MSNATWTPGVRPLMDDPADQVEITYRYPTEAEAIERFKAVVATGTPTPSRKPGEAPDGEEGTEASAEVVQMTQAQLLARVESIQIDASAARACIVKIVRNGVEIPGDLSEYTAKDVRFTHLLEADAGWLFRIAPAPGSPGA